MKRKVLAVLLGVFVLGIAAVCAVRVGTVYRDLSLRLHSDPMIFYREESDSSYRAPGGVVYFAYPCTPLESALIHLFFLGEALPESHEVRTPLPGYASYDSETVPYFLRGSEDTHILIGETEEFGTKILVSLSRSLDNYINYVCGDQEESEYRLPHDTFFPDMLELVNECTDSTAITSIWVETRYGYNNEPAAPAETITDPTEFETLLQLLRDARFDCGSIYDCSQAMDLSALYRELNNAGGCGLYTLTSVEFVNDTALLFWYYPETDVLFFNAENFKTPYWKYEMTTTYPHLSLHFTPEDMESVKKLLNLAQ